MLPDSTRDSDDRFVELLAAYDAAVARGRVTPLPPDVTLPHAQDRLARAQSVVERLERDRVRRGAGGELSPPCPKEAPGLVYDADGRLTQLEQFQIMRELGSGGAGTVYLAYDLKNLRQVALKIPRLEVLAAPSLRYRFLREGRTVAGFDHPNLVAIYETGEIGPICYMVSAYCRGVSLREWFVRRDTALAPPEAASFLTIIAEAVGYFHERGVVHRDLKPANILLERAEPTVEHDTASTNGVLAPFVSDLDSELSAFIPKVSDFGLAKNLDLDEGQTRSGTILGTPRYMAPEQAEGRVRIVGPASDVYALGVILYELLTKHTPSWDAAADGPALVSPRKFSPDIPRELEATCRRCLERDPAKRYPSASALATVLRDFTSNDSSSHWIANLWKRALHRTRNSDSE